MLFTVDDKTSVLLFFVLPLNSEFVFECNWFLRKSNSSILHAYELLGLERILSVRRKKWRWINKRKKFTGMNEGAFHFSSFLPTHVWWRTSTTMPCYQFQLFSFRSFYHASDRQGLSILLTKLLCLTKNTHKKNPVYACSSCGTL